MFVGSGGPVIAVSYFLLLIKFIEICSLIFFGQSGLMLGQAFKFVLEQIQHELSTAVEHVGSNSCNLYQIRAGTCSIVVFSTRFLKNLQLSVAFCPELFQLGFQDGMI